MLYPILPILPTARGCLQLIHQGAEIIVSEEKLLEMLGAIPTTNQSAPVNLSPSLPPETSPVVNAAPPANLEPRLAQVYQLFNRDASLV
jgi:DNA processing protein